MNESKEKKDEKKEPRTITIPIIPQCCREGWESCEHIVGNKNKVKKKKNVGL